MDAAFPARLIRGAALAVLAALATPAPDARAFGVLGHEVIASIAAREMDADARTEVERLLGDQADPALREASMWPDHLRELPENAWTAPLHFVNVVEGTCEYVPNRDCRLGRCAVAAIAQFAARLGDRTRSDAERATALRWVVHLVGDLHQPLHVGRRADRGGNDVQVRLGGQGTNLHRLWDADMLRESGRLRGRPWRPVEYADVLRARGRPAADVAWSDGAPVKWARESCELMRTVYPGGRRVDDAYVQRHLPTVERRLAEAGYRLAALLDAVL